MRALAFSLLLALPGIKALPTVGQGSLSFTPIALDRDHPERRNFGALELLGAWRLKSDLRDFGGISALHVRDGHFTALADTAELLRFRFDGRQAMSRVEGRPLPGIYTPGNESPDHDSESLTLDPATGTVWVGFETSNAIRRFAPGLRDKKGWAAPAAMAHWPENTGPEALARLPDGRFLVIGEGPFGPKGSSEAFLFRGDPTRDRRPPLRFFYRPPAGFRPTDAAALPDGRLLVLNRHFSLFDGVAAALTILDPRRITPGAMLAGREIARLAPPLTVDNMEGLSVEPTAKRGRVVVWLASDDNFNPLQQNLLMRFALELERVR